MVQILHINPVGGAFQVLFDILMPFTYQESSSESVRVDHMH